MATLNILCFGDSLTEGYSMYGMRFTPFSEWMKEVLERELGTGKGEGSEIKEVLVETDGRSGDLVTGGFRRRMEVHYTSERILEKPYDWVVFLGGTNDIAYAKTPTKIFTTIRSIIAMPLESGARVLMMTVPECHAKSEALDERRDALNDMIKEEARINDDVYVLDLHAKMPYHDMPLEERTEMWDDGLHFTPMGYERIGKMVAEILLEILKGESEK